MVILLNRTVYKTNKLCPSSWEEHKDNNTCQSYQEQQFDDKVFVTYKVSAATKTIVISGDSFPGTYYVVGDTYARSDVDGSDQFFQFIIPKAKVTSENTITLEAEGDPAVFNMSLTVLRPDDGIMMQLVQYTLDDPTVQG